MTIRTFMASNDAHVSSSGFTNYFGRMNAAEVSNLHKNMRAELGEHVIIDGTDDWGAKVEHRPETFFFTYKRSLGIPNGPEQCDGLLGYYHSGISGISKSGIVVTPEMFDELSEWYANEYGKAIDAGPLRLTFNSNSTAL